LTASHHLPSRPLPRAVLNTLTGSETTVLMPTRRRMRKTLSVKDYKLALNLCLRL
jgi:hypothetical protein